MLDSNLLQFVQKSSLVNKSHVDSLLSFKCLLSVPSLFQGIIHFLVDSKIKRCLLTFKVTSNKEKCWT